MFSLSRESERIAGVLLLSIVAVESGGYYLTRVASGGVELTEFQWAFARAGHAHAGILMPAGFFFSSMGSGSTRPNGLVVLLWLGAASLTVGVIALGLALLRGPRSRPNQ